MRGAVVALVALALLGPCYAQQQVPLDELGPISVGADGSMHRIANWQELTENERAAAKRALAKRNAKRLASLREQQQQQQHDNERQHRLRRLWRCVKRWAQRLVGRRRQRADELHFAAEFVPEILAGRKRATTRLVSREPHLGRLQQGDRVCGTSNAGESFASLAITGVETRRFGAIDDELAAIEGLPTAAALQETLLRFYPRLRPRDQLVVLHFEVVDSEADAAGAGTARSCIAKPAATREPVSAAAELSAAEDARSGARASTAS